MQIVCYVELLLTALVGLQATSSAQSIISDRDSAPAITRAEAYSGYPFGVGVVKYRMCAGDDLLDRTGATRLQERNQRIFYPVFSRPASSRFLQKIAGKFGAQPESLKTAWFLFTGNEPLEIQLQGQCAATELVRPEVVREKKFARILNQWWRQYNDDAIRQQKVSDYPPFIEDYLRSMLSRRLNLSLPREKQKNKDELTRTLELIFDVESLRSESIKNGMLGLADNGIADRPIPSEVFWEYPNLDADGFVDVEVEPFAYCVPEECFYLRFGNWNNQIWLRRLMDEFGGDLGRMINLRGLRPKIKSKFLNQLAIESTEFDRLFGGNLISDVAVIGQDMFFNDGAAVGVLLRAKNSNSLSRNLNNKREKFAERYREIGCVVDTVDVDGEQVQFLRTPDNRYRSFYIHKNDNHLVCTSLAMVRRFIEACNGNKCLAESLEFKYARQQMPLDRDDTVFVFVPSKLLHNLLGPQYQIELARRNRSLTDMQIVELASLAGQNEGFNAEKLDNLVTHGFLPPNFGVRPDGSQLQRVNEKWVDSIRGQRGFFVPISDVAISGVTEFEVDWYRQRRIYLTENLSQAGPDVCRYKTFQPQRQHRTNNL